MRKKNGAGRIRISKFRLCYKAALIKTLPNWHKKHKYRPVEQDRKPEVSPHIRGGAKTAEEQAGETTFSPTKSSKEQLNGEQSSQNNF